MEHYLKKARIEIPLIFLLFLYLLPRVSMEYDMNFWKEWALNIHRVGLTHAYDTDINYFPVYLYGLWFYDLLQGSEKAIADHIYCIKILFVCFDFLPVVVLCCFRQRWLPFKVPYAYLLLNIAYVFNSMVWGQIDGMYANLAFLAVVLIPFTPGWGWTLYVLALNTKAQAIVFLPIVLLATYFGTRNFKHLFSYAWAPIATQAILLIPFYGTGGVAKLLAHAGNSVGLYHNLSISAFNIWYLLSRQNPYFVNDADVFFLFSYRTWGLLMFGIAAVLLLWPAAKTVYRYKAAGKPVDAHLQKVLFLGVGMLCLSFFYFNAEMHERYAHPVLICFFFFGVVSRNYRLYALASLPYLLSLDKCFSYPDGFLPWTHFKVLYASVIIALWYSSTMVYGGYLYYRLNKAALPCPTSNPDCRTSARPVP